jgi:hypothetical protein
MCILTASDFFHHPGLRLGFMAVKLRGQPVQRPLSRQVRQKDRDFEDTRFKNACQTHPLKYANSCTVKPAACRACQLKGGRSLGASWRSQSSA